MEYQNAGSRENQPLPEQNLRRLTRRRCFRLLLHAGLLAPVAVRASVRSYRDLLDRAITAMEKGNHASALSPLKEALRLDRTETAGLLTLGTLYLHTGSFARAKGEFERAGRITPEDPLIRWGSYLCTPVFSSAVSLPEPKGGREAGAAISEDLPLLLEEYRTLLRGNAQAVRNATSYVGAGETNLLRLEIAGIAALRSGDRERGVALLQALLERPEMQPLAEDRALLLSFLPHAPAQAGAPPLPSALGLPEPAVTAILSGIIRLTPPQPLPDGVAMVSYEIQGGGGYTASVNYPPFITEWNSRRYPDGIYTIRAVACGGDGSELRSVERAVQIKNGGAPASRSLTAEDRRQFRERLARLLTPRPARKAAHFALAEAAAADGDEEGALRHIESVVAIDPLYGNARESLRQYNHVVKGKSVAFWSGVTTEKLVALTFDDGPHPATTPVLLDALHAAGAVATFFVVGIRAEAAPLLIKRMKDEGHELANHSYSHPNLTFLTRSGVERELCRTSCIVRDITGVRPRYYRPPGGNVNQMVSEVAGTLGMSGAFWTLDGLMYEKAPFSPKHLTAYVVGRVRAGAIVLLHNAPANTIAAIPEIVRGLKQKGYTFVTVSELARRARPSAPAVPPHPAKMKE